MQSDLVLTDSHFHSPKCSFPSINAGCSADDLPERIKLYSSEGVFFGASMGPWETDNRTDSEIDSQLEILKKNIEKYNPLFIGEIGLDYHYMYGTKESQKRLFEIQMDMADELKKRVLIHCREASEDVCSVIRTHCPSYGGVIHCCDGSRDLINTALNHGFFISFAGNLTYKSNQSLRDALKTVPKDRLLLETDSPYLSPVPLRGLKNCSNNIIYTYNCAAETLEMKTEDLAALVYSNFRTFCTEWTH